MSWSSFNGTFSFSQWELLAGACCLVMGFLVMLRMNYVSRRKTMEMKGNEESYKVNLAMASQNISRHEQDALQAEISERRRVEASLSHAAYHDRLTGLRNRSYFIHELRNTREYTIPRYNLYRAVVYVDIDSFKAVNETLGQKFGDLLLKEVASRLQLSTRERDVLARIGGDEFAILLNDLNGMEQARRFADRIVTIIEEPMMLADIRLSVTVSVGLCEVTDAYVEVEDILRDADTAMNHAKRQGGGRSVSYDESMRSEAFAALQIKQQIQAGLTNNEFVVYYMPLVDMVDGSIYGVEALVRWNHPVRGLLAPGAFIQVAEDSGLIVPLGSWILRQACTDYKAMQRHMARPMLLSVNVSSRQLDQAVFLTELTQVLEETGVPPKMLQLELLENILIADAGRIGGLFTRIREMGIKIAFDDFGTGYSSLSYLARYPIDTLKIDQSFVREMARGSVNADIVQLVIRLAHTIGMNVSAEGVETKQQASDLIEYGCRVAQGYLYSPPISLDAVTKMMAASLVTY